ncbi:hypothetical protein [Halorubrum coriense]|uniref:hypothetical protein n=1 Tax=Halorubrum coriense TaxID=64713 RepID=UPI0009B5D05A|nr:hypothetical protein [Halorubrum coriense]
MSQKPQSESVAPAGDTDGTAHLGTTIGTLDQLSLASTVGTCQYCGRSLTEGDEIVAYVYKPTGERTHHVGHCVCADPNHRQQEVFTLGVHELLVAGRVGIASDAATQSTWPIFIEPVTVAVSAPATTTLRWLPPETSVDDHVAPTLWQRRQRQVARTQVTVSNNPTAPGGDD